MIINKLDVTSLRAFKQATFDFKPGMNLIVGINGVGKTTVLDALRICLSKIITETSNNTGTAQGFEIRDIRDTEESLNITCDFEIQKKTFSLIINKQRNPISSNEGELPRELKKKKRSREMREIIQEKAMLYEKDAPKKTPDYESILPIISEYFPDIKKSKEQTLVIYFSTRRSIVVEQKTPSSKISPAFAESLSTKRDSNLKEIADWFHSKEVLGEESPIHLRHLGILREAINNFLPELKNLHVIKTSDGPHFKIEKEGITLSLSQLSDGERGMLCLVLELSKRLSQANPELDDPNKKGTAIVLIDELDLHLHPKWQRTIVANLVRTFPNCQFIATTHSPQIIPSVEPENILMIDDKKIIRPDRSLGMDSNWVLRILMKSDDRPTFSIKAITIVEKLIEKGKFEEALMKMNNYLKDGLDISDWAILRSRIARLKSFEK